MFPGTGVGFGDEYPNFTGAHRGEWKVLFAVTFESMAS